MCAAKCKGCQKSLGNPLENFRVGKLSSGKTFAVGTQNDHSQENFCGALGHGQHVLYTASDLRGKLLRSTEKLQKMRKFFHSKVFPYTVTSAIYSNGLQ